MWTKTCAKVLCNSKETLEEGTRSSPMNIDPFPFP
ncbi:hypothetical protein SLEP1_g45376 [Rubroshorea leprosula]|uniref:Uncharacterized protein n=1 Tax=Rubroshorea leprosula TaxID=152421 RepID=A0AAV5LJ07_9ROSI|nr:hypothetical protein SLEP1_g45376 [Rubroshorea leprosula]